MIYLVYFQQDFLHNIMSDNFEICFVQQVFNILLAACEEIVQANHLHTRGTRVGCPVQCFTFVQAEA